MGLNQFHTSLISGGFFERCSGMTTGGLRRDKRKIKGRSDQLQGVDESRPAIDAELETVLTIWVSEFGVYPYNGCGRTTYRDSNQRLRKHSH